MFLRPIISFIRLLSACEKQNAEFHETVIPVGTMPRRMFCSLNADEEGVKKQRRDVNLFAALYVIPVLILNLSFQAFLKCDLHSARMTEPLEQVITHLGNPDP